MTKKGKQFYKPADVDLEGLKSLFNAEEKLQVQKEYEVLIGKKVDNGTIRSYFAGNLNIPEDFIQACLKVAKEKRDKLTAINEEINTVHNDIISKGGGKRKPHEPVINKKIDSFNLLLNK